MPSNITDLEKSFDFQGRTSRYGQLGKAVQAGSWWLPHDVQLREGFLAWTRDPKTEGHATSHDGLLGSFLRLSSADGDRIVEFALQHGLLCPWRHPNPDSHPTTASPHHLTMIHERHLFTEPTPCIETVYEWTQTARFLSLLLELVAIAEESHPSPRALEQADLKIQESGFFDGPGRVPGRGGELDLVNGLYGFMEMPGQLPGFLMCQSPSVIVGSGIGNAVKQLAAAVVNSMLAIGNAGFLRVEADTFIAAPSAGSLIGALGLQMLDLCGGGAKLTLCDECGELYKPNRKPASGRRKFCEPCRSSGASRRLASRDYRKRQSSSGQ